MIKAVLFDMDGIVIDSEPLHRKAQAKAFERFGIKIPEKPNEKYIGMTMSEIIKDVIDEKKSGINWKDVLEARNELVLELIPQMCPIKSTIKLINSLGSYKKALATSQVKKIAYSMLDHFKIKEEFDAVITGDDVKKGKPDPEIFLKAAMSLDMAPEFCLVIEDSKNGVIAAKKAGMKVIAFENPNNPKQDFSLADIVVDDMKKVTIETIRRL